MQNNANEGQELPFLSHLIELRDRLLRAVICVLLVFLALAYYANDIYALVAEPLMKYMPANSSMIATEVASPFFTPFKLALVVSIFISIPYLLYQFWAFVAPGLYQHERRFILPLLIASTLLFFLGVAFAYFVVFPLMFKFLTAAAPAGVTVMTDISHYLDFVLTLFFAFGICFEVPIFTVVLVWAGLVTPRALAEQRPYVIVGAFIVGMVLTPPDVISQTLLAVPMWLLFEAGLLCSRWFMPKPSESDSNKQLTHS
jgi:sec-independent protein translocase protein TatC